jgi:hypothetical protein
MRKFLFLILIPLAILGCKKKNQSTGTASLKLTINGQEEIFSMSDPDYNNIDNGNCFSWTGSGALVENLVIGDFTNGDFTLWAGNGNISNNNYNCQVNATDYCGTPHFEIYVAGDLNTRLEQLYNTPIFKLEPSANGTVKVSDLGQGKVSLSWSGNLNVMDFNSNILGTLSSTFAANKVAVTDNR